ncbi:MAG: Flp family type IVb pilin [Betaproteobacteria bacterium]|nr:Flp family type IVb pilin [Betaproteobacteria bacterium]
MNQMDLYKMMLALKKSAVDFGRDEEGAQIVEYGLIIAVVSIALVIALSAIAAGGGPFTNFIARVTTCLTGAVGSCV